MADNTEGQEPQNIPEGEPEPQNPEGQPEPQSGDEQLTPEQIADLKKKADASSQNFERAKKAEAKAKELEGKLNVPSQEGQLTPKDYLALTEHKVSSEDFDEVVRVSKILGKNLTETLKDRTMQSILTERVEERRTAQATQTGQQRRGGSQASPESLIEAARQGTLKESDIGKLVEAEEAAKRK